MKNLHLKETEAARVEALKEYQVMDTPPEKDYDEITQLASIICETPISLITLLDDQRQFIKSGFGTDLRETTLDVAFCAHAIEFPRETFMVPDARQDSRFAGNPFVTGAANVVFYTGVPLVNAEGVPLGTLCVIDQKPRKLSEVQLKSLKILARQVMKLLELRKINKDLHELRRNLEIRNKELEQFAYVVSHDIKSPLSSIVLTSEMLRENFGTTIDEGNDQLLKVLNRASYKIKNLVDGILSYYRGEQAIGEDAETFDLTECLQSIVSVMHVSPRTEIRFSKEPVTICANKTAFEQIMLNLVQNAVKYNDKDSPLIGIGFREDAAAYHFEISDNGRGIAKEDQERIFQPFTNLGVRDDNGGLGTGIGLATVKKLVERLGGKIIVRSSLASGSTFAFSLKKIRVSGELSEAASGIAGT